ncbi:hypothetical protein [Hyphomicrobium sp. 99]|uniref:hypothetical protein n=1 Tax=Hyphomicrobium sp. 99 TaxID=1163419 RepID=UPI0005F85E12|nr:hypothetical protein [Hyphomicrobium sp. 99]
MSVFSVGLWPVKALRGVLGPLMASVAAVSVAGCATDNDAYYAGSAPPVYVAQGPAVEMEQDGLPVQASPSARIRTMPDDPTQPFSRNYGGPNPADVSAAPVAVKVSNGPVMQPDSIPADLPPPFRKQLVAAVDAAG